MAKDLQGTAQNELEEVSPPSSSSSTPDREQRISALVSLIERLSGDAQLTVIDDERSNLNAFLKEPYSETLKTKVRAILK